MHIQVSGFTGFPTYATIKAYVGMVIMGKTVIKVNQKSLILSHLSKPEAEEKVDSLSIPYWAISTEDLPKIKDNNGLFYKPREIEVVMHTLCQGNPHDAVAAIAGVAEFFTKNNNLKKESIADNFDDLSSLTVFSVINKLTNC